MSTVRKVIYGTCAVMALIASMILSGLAILSPGEDISMLLMALALLGASLAFGREVQS